MTISLGLSELNVNQAFVNETIDSSRSNKTGWTTYLKNHWWIVALMLFLTLASLGAGLKYLDDAAKQDKASNIQNTGLLSKINPFAANPLPTATPVPTPQLSKEYIYAGSRVLAVEDVNASAAPPADLAVWRRSTGTWWVMGGTGSAQTSQQWGISTDEPAQGDYDGDGKTDFCVFRPDTTAQTGTWYIIYSSSGGSYQVQYGLHTDKAAQADYDGDGKTDIAVFRPSTGVWYISQSSNGNTLALSLGTTGDTPIPADFDGDGRADIAIHRSSNNTFYSTNSSNAQTQTTGYGTSGDKPVCGDYDGDGRADIAVWRSSNTTWYYKKSSDGNTTQYQFGIGTDKPVQNDYDGDGKVDMALWRAVTSGANDVGKWFIYQSSTGTIRQEQWGITDDIPVPAYYRR